MRYKLHKIQFFSLLHYYSTTVTLVIDVSVDATAGPLLPHNTEEILWPTWLARWLSALLQALWREFETRARYLMWVEFVVGSYLILEGFSPGSVVLFPPQKPSLLGSNSIGTITYEKPPSGYVAIESVREAAWSSCQDVGRRIRNLGFNSRPDH